MQADAFAKKLGYASELRSGLVKLQVTFYYMSLDTIIFLVWNGEIYLKMARSW